MEVVQREEFEAVRDMAVKARAENKALAARIDALEARIAELAAQPAARRRTDAARRSAVQKNNSFNFSTKPGQRKSLFGESLTRLP